MNVKKISHVDLVLYNNKTNPSSLSTSKKPDTVPVYKDLPRILALEEKQCGKRKEQMRDVHVNVYKEFFSNTSNTLKCCVQNYWLTSEEVVLMDIHTAASLGDCGGIDAALARCENINCCSHLSGWTPLMFAASRNHLVAVKHMILKGANVCTHSSKDGRTALALAASGGSCDTVSVLAAETFTLKNAGFKFGVNLIFEATNKAVQERLPWLQQDFHKAYTDLVSLTEDQNLGLDSWDFYGWTALMHAIFFGTHEVVKMLVHKGSDVNVTDIFGKTPLIVAIECLRDEIVFTLLNAGADPTTKTNRGLTAVEYADLSECPRIINMVHSATEFMSELSNESLRTVILVLAVIGLRKYIPIFIEHNIDVKKFNELTEDHLRNLGLTSMGPRKKVMTAVRERFTERT